MRSLCQLEIDFKTSILKAWLHLDLGFHCKIFFASAIIKSSSPKILNAYTHGLIPNIGLTGYCSLKQQDESIGEPIELIKTSF